MPVTDLLLGLMFEFGYWGLLLAMALGIAGLPMPDELLLTASGYMIAQGRMSLGFTMLAAIGGSVAGMSLSYWVGRKAFAGFVRKFGSRVGLTEERQARFDRQFERYGHSVLLIGFFVPGMRHLTALLYGASRKPFGAFALHAALGSLTWTSAFLLFGVMLGENWRDAAEWAQRELAAALAVIALIAAIAWLHKRHLGKRGASGT
ncbi:DedA family protein [Cohnella algarum]|uniref:DedA family protein n=1 Tax=Cohnella algarum TaxID=2044859 RepID=UPI0019679FD4|nr:DedA family protein [Cohnella algarum]MBN2983462.1 DedA family protein [Cohnella algarum]